MGSHSVTVPAPPDGFLLEAPQIHCWKVAATLAGVAGLTQAASAGCAGGGMGLQTEMSCLCKNTHALLQAPRQGLLAIHIIQLGFEF